MATNRLSRSARIRRLKKTREAFNNTQDLTSRQRDANRRIAEYLKSKDAQSVAPINERDKSRELDEVEDVTRESLKARPIEGIDSDWDDDQQEESSDSANDSQQSNTDNSRRERKREEPEKDAEKDKEGNEELRNRKNKEKLEDDRPKAKGEKPAEPTAKPSGTPAKPPVGAGAGGTAAAGEGAAVAGGTSASAAAGGTAVAGGSLALGWVILIIAVLAVVVSVVIYFVQKNKLISSAGGSFPQYADIDDPKVRATFEKVKALIHPAEGQPVVIIRGPAVEEDLTGTKVGDEKKTRADYRILKTIEHLADQGWSKIVVGVTASGGPDLTLRQGTSGSGDEVSIQAQSAYVTGQAIGIVALGQTSPGLTACLQLGAPIPVEVAWQETSIENLLRPIHEKLQVNASILYRAVNVQRAHSGADTNSSRSLLGKGKDAEFAAKTQGNLKELISALDGNRSTNPATLRYAKEALADIDAALKDGTQAAYEQMDRGLAKTFRALNAANMQGWEGSRDNGCRLWKAFESRQNIRTLAFHVMRMPVELKEGKSEFNSAFVVRQLILFSPEDDLDNGLPNKDVFPSGAIAVGVGGVSFDNLAKDGKITEADNHFLALPQDNGILSKVSTIFAKQTEDGDAIEDAGEVPVSSDARKEFDTALDLNDESEARVSYKTFVHIGF